MRIGILPQISIKKFFGDSGFSFAIRNARAYASAGHTVFVLLPLTTGLKEEDTPPDIPGVYYENIDGISTFYSIHPDITTIHNLVHPRIGRLCLDVVLTTQVCTSSVFAGLQGDCNPADGYVTILHDTMAFSPHDSMAKGAFSSTSMGGGSDHDLAELRALAYPTVHRLYFSTPLEQQHGFEGAKRMLSAYALKNMKAISRVQAGGVYVDKVLEKTKGVKKHKEFTLFFGGRLNSNKRPEVMIKSYLRHIALGNPPNIVITSPKVDGDFYDTLTDEMKSFIKFKSKVGPDEFLQEAAKCHAIVYPSKGEGFALGIVEMVLAGIVTIFPDLPWVHALFGDSLDGFPFLFKKREDINGMLNIIKDNYAAATVLMQPLRNYCKANYNYKECQAKIEADLKELVDSVSEYYSDPDKLSPVMELFLETAAKMPNEFSLEELIAAACDSSKVLQANYFTKITPLSRRYPSRLGIKRLLEYQGIATTVQNKHVIFVKNKCLPDPTDVVLSKKKGGVHVTHKGGAKGK